MRTTVVLSFAIVLMMALLVAWRRVSYPRAAHQHSSPHGYLCATHRHASPHRHDGRRTDRHDGGGRGRGDGMMMWEVSDELKAYAAEHAGGPRRHLHRRWQLLGPGWPFGISRFHGHLRNRPGDDDGNVPLDAIEDVRWVFESDYYRQLIETANLTNPTELHFVGRECRTATYLHQRASCSGASTSAPTSFPTSRIGPTGR